MGRPAFQFSNEILELMGKMPDGQLARMARCSLTAIINRRNRMGIAPYNPRAGFVPVVAASAAAAAVTPAPAPAPALPRRTAAQDAVTAAKPSPEGMVIPYEIYARLAQEAWAG